jgi:glycosyltransferase involved in cell wall biosynthesis
MTPEIKTKRILMLADFACNTGFATVAHNIVAQLLKTNQYQIDIVGINYNGMPNEWMKIYPTVRLLPAVIISGGDLFGREGYLQMLSSGAYDITFILQDTFNIETIAPKMIEMRNNLIADGKKAFKFIFYFPIDATPRENWITKSVALADIPVAYTQYGYDHCLRYVPSLKDKLRIVPHGIEPNSFFPLSKEKKDEFKHEYFLGRADGKYLITNVNRNQPRKDIARTLQIFRLFKNQVPNAYLYLHMNHNDVAYNLLEAARNFDLNEQEDFLCPKNYSEHDGIPVGVLNGIYNCSDVVMTTTLGEGWGLAVTEAMAAKAPVIAPDHTSLSEIIGTDRGTLVKAGYRVSDNIVIYGDNERLRPLADVADYVEKLMWMKNNPEDVRKKVENAYNYVIANWTWEKVGETWRDIFASSLVAVKDKDKEIGRNDPCPYCQEKGVVIKWKKCTTHNAG